MRNFSKASFGFFGIAVFGAALACSNLSRAELVAADDMAIEREIHLKPESTVSSQSVCLQDLVDDSWLQMRCRYEGSRCCLWNLGGKLNRTLSREQIQKDVRDIGITGFVLRVGGTEAVSVTQTHRALSAEEVQKKLQENLAKNYGVAIENVKVSNARLSNQVYVALQDESAWDVQLPDAFAQRMSAKIVSQGVGTQPLGWISADISRMAPAYVAKRNIRPGETINETDFELKPTNMLSVSGGAFERGSFPAGMRAQRSVLKGSPLLSEEVERIPDVKLGDGVTLVLKSDSLKITTKGVAQGAGAKGDTINVQLPKYNRTFRGRLVGDKTVEVWL